MNAMKEEYIMKDIDSSISRYLEREKFKYKIEGSEKNWKGTHP